MPRERRAELLPDIGERVAGDPAAEMSSMLNRLIAHLADYPFDRLRVLLDGLSAPEGFSRLSCRWGNHGTRRRRWLPRWWRRMPTIGGAIHRSTARRNFERRSSVGSSGGTDCHGGLVDPERNVLPVAGTRKALFLIAQTVVPQKNMAERRRC